MTEMIEVKVAELEGAALDWAVACAVEAWKTAHELFPTWTLDATFSGVQPMVYSDGQAICQLVPNNPMRQDPQRYSPSTDWTQGGPLIERYKVEFRFSIPSEVMASAFDGHLGVGYRLGSNHLIAAMRAIVAAELGETVQVPAELVEVRHD